MPYSFSGIGTKFYGKYETGQKNAYIATEWIVFLYIPILPIGSFRVHSAEKTDNIASHNSHVDVTERVSFQWQHICNVYAFIAAIAILAYLVANRRTALVNLFTGKSFNPSQVSGVPPSSEVPSSPKPTKPAYERPATAENGTPFPETSGYIEGYEQAFTEGNAALTVDNAKNDYDIHVKLYNLDKTSPALTSVFFIKAQEIFTVEPLNPGNYELRYRNLETGGLVRTDSFALEEKLDQSSGNLVSTHLTLNLYGSLTGDMQTYPISEEDFSEDTDSTQSQ